MHMADALLSPAVGAGMWLASAAALAWSHARLRRDADERIVPLMGVLGAFVFAAQMINFAIPGTGSSGHLGGGLLLALLLGPHAGLVVIASVLTVQALFFADGGLLALGANIFNLGVVPCFVAYPLYRVLTAGRSSPRRQALAVGVAAIVALQLGALGVVLQTTASGIASLPTTAFLALMLPIHAAIGVVEGLATAAVLAFVRRAQPQWLERADAGRPASGPRRVLVGVLGAAALLTGTTVSWLASAAPDGLEWSVERVAGAPELEAPETRWHRVAGEVQQHTAWMPGYALPAPAADGDPQEAQHWPAVDAGTSLAGLLGGVLTLALVGGLARWLARRRR